MHCVVIRHDMLDRHRGIVDAVWHAYSDAKQAAYRRQLGATLLPWGKSNWARTFELFGNDPLPYGLTAINRMVIERLTQYLQRQGFIRETPDIDALFACPTRP
jgi:4,5-dihydroxyphthalate decarboxylase